MADNDLIAYSRLADDLIGRADKDKLAAAMKILALNIGWYHQRYSNVPQEELLHMVRREALGEDGKRRLLHGMQNLVGALAEMMGSGRTAVRRLGTERC
jgi:hypothetical protein